MCGIGGMVALREGLPAPELGALRRMAGALRHRGPDGAGLYRSAEAGLCHTRLSLIDRATGAQPLRNEDGSLWAVLDGEILNYLELREELVELGHRFRTRSDTEVVVHAFEAWGERAFARFNGQFAVALWDERARALTLARDRIGGRPLHVVEHGGRVYFASEVKALFAADPAIPRALDAVGLDEAFTFGATVAPQGVFAGVSEVPPGYARTYVNGDRRERAYHRPRYPLAGGAPGDDGAFTGSMDDAVEAVRDALEAAVRLRMLRSEVPVGCVLSGGLDSAVVAALGQRARGGRLSTFSLRFAGADAGETARRRAMTDYLGGEHHELFVSREDVARVFPDVVDHAERPLLRADPAPLFLLSRLVREAGIEVVLRGDGADEMFAGRGLDRGFALGSRSTTALHALLSPEVRRAASGVDVTARLLGSLPADFARWTPLSQDQYLEVRTRLAGYTLSSLGERMLAAHAVQGRLPFLDAEVTALATSLPDACKLDVLERAAEGVVPRAVLGRDRGARRAPDALCFAGGRAPAWAEEAMSEAALREAGIFDPVAAHALWSRCRAHLTEAPLAGQDDAAVLGVLSTQLLHDRFVRRAPEAMELRVEAIVDRV